MSKIVTYTGRIVDLANPQADSIAIEDVAWALAHEIRWNGCLGYLTVLQHSIAVAQEVKQAHPDALPHVELAALLHDAPEAYTGDIISPLKDLLCGCSAYDHVENSLSAACAKAFDLKELQPFEALFVKEADKRVAHFEAWKFGNIAWQMGLEKVSPGYALVPWRRPENIPVYETGLSNDAEFLTSMFLKYYVRLRAEIVQAA